MEYGLVALWLVAYAVLTALGLPIAARLFPAFSGRGAGLAPTVALAILTIGGFAAGHVATSLALPTGLGLLVGLAVVAALDWRRVREDGLGLGGEKTTAERNSLLAVDVDRRAILETAIVFAGGFLLVVAIRAADPAVHPLGGEKFLDFGLLRTLARAEALPPQDMWFAGEPVQYYYGGHLTASLLAWLTGTPTRFAYNLALAGFYAALVTAAYELAGAIGAYRDVPRRVAGAVAVFFVGLASNLLTAGRVVLGSLPPSLQRSVAEQVAAQTSRSTAEDLLTGVDEFSYWTASRVIDGTINEFPLFAWLNGDLHAHMMGTPFLLLAAALSYSYYRTPGRERWRRRLLVFLAVPLLAGLVAVIDTWSFPSVFGLLVLAIALAPADPLSLFPRRLAGRIRDRAGVAPADLRGRSPASVRAEALRPAAAIAAGALAGLVGVAFASPFLLSAVGGDRSIAVLVAAERSSLGGLVLVHGAFLAAFAAHLLERIRPDRPWVLAAAIALLAAVALSIEAPVLLVVVPLGVAAWIGLRLARPLGYEAVLILAGAGLVTIVEFLYVVEQAGPLRLNTVFKVYAQVWVLWGVAAGVAVPGLLSGRERVAAAWPTAASRFRPGVDGDTRSGSTGVDAESGSSTSAPVGSGDGAAQTGTAGSWPDRSGVGGAVAVALVAGLVLSTSIYGGLALSAHFDRGGPGTLDATAFVERDHPEDAPAIEYVDGLEGQPTLVSAPATSRCLDLQQNPPCPPGMYDWDSSPAASLTGVPTVAGWAHEIGYRGTEPYRQRARDVDAIYTGDPDTRARLLAAYDVEYVWVGNAERERYGEVSFAETPGVEPVFEEGRVTIYRVDQNRLSTGS
jgi:YYY domain-containing protein